MAGIAVIWDDMTVVAMIRNTEWVVAIWDTVCTTVIRDIDWCGGD